MILHEEHFDGKLKLQLVNGDDIMRSYKNRSKASSCQSSLDRWKATKFYSFVPGISMLRVMRHNILMARALIFEGETDDGKLRIPGKIYTRKYGRDYCHYNSCPESMEGITVEFKDALKRFIDVMQTHKRLELEILPHPEIYPCIDVVKYANRPITVLSNHEFRGGWDLTDHEYGEKRRVY